MDDTDQARETSAPLENPVDLSGEPLNVQRVYLYLWEFRSVSLRKRLDFIFPDQERIARELALGVRTVKRCIARLRACGVVRAVRAKNPSGAVGNRYYFIGERLASTALARGQSGPSQGPKWPESGAKVARVRGQSGPSQGPKWPLHNEQKKKQEEDNNSNNSAAPAAVVAVDLLDQAAERAEAEDARKILQALDYPLGLIDEALDLRGPGFVVGSRAFWAWKLSDKVDPIENRDGFLRSCFRTPTVWGYRFENGAWIAPPAGGRSQAEDPEARKAKREAALRAEEERRDSEAAEADSWRERWESVSEEVREDIEAEVRSRGAKGPSWVVESLCRGEFRRQIEAGERLLEVPQ